MPQGRASQGKPGPPRDRPHGQGRTAKHQQRQRSPVGLARWGRGGEEAACRVRGGSDVCAAGQADRGAAEGSAGPFRPGGRAGSTWCGRWAGQEVRGQRGRERGAGPWHRALGTPPALGTHRHRAGRRGSARRVARGTWRWPWAPEGQGLLTLSTARILAHMKTSRGRSSRAELCSSFST